MRVVPLAQRAILRCLALTLIATYAHAAATLRHFDIQSEVAALALKEFARQADISLVFSSTVVAHRQTSGIHGDFTVTEGLRKLLDGSGLSFKQVSANTIAINAASTTTDRETVPGSAPAANPSRDEFIAQMRRSAPGLPTGLLRELLDNTAGCEADEFMYPHELPREVGDPHRLVPARPARLKVPKVDVSTGRRTGVTIRPRWISSLSSLPRPAAPAGRGR